MKAQTSNIAVVRSVWRRLKKAKIRDLEIRDLEPIKDVKGGGGGVRDESKPMTGGAGTIGSH
jgi:hypothetical protein